MVPLFDLAVEKKEASEIKKELARVFDSKSYILGKRLDSFEKKFADFVGTREAIGVANGTDALKLSLMALGIGAGDKVLTVAFTSPFTAVGILEAGATPVFCDIDEKTFTIDLSDCEKKLDSKVCAIMPVHIFGNPCNMDEIIKFAKVHKLKVIEDACQAVGAKIGKKMIGSFGDMAAFSFYPTKNLGAAGDAGMIVTNNLKTSAKARILRHGGQTKRFWHEYRGVNSRLDEMQAAILEIKLEKLAENNSKREVLAQRYREKLSDLPIGFQKVIPGTKSAWHIFAILSEKRNQLKEFLSKKGIVSDIYYPYPLNRQPAFQEFGSNLPVSEKVCSEVLALPLYPGLSFESQDYIIKSIEEFFGDK